MREPAGNGIPAIVEPIVHSLEQAPSLPRLDPARAGRIPLIIEAARRLKSVLPQADVRVPVSGPFSIATSLRGGELLSDVALQPRQVRAFLLGLVEGQVRFCEAVHEAELGIALFESAAAPPLLSPAQFLDVELPALKQLIAGVREATGQSLPCVIGGDTEPILDYILETGTTFVICPAETDMYAFMRRLGSRQDVTVRINLDPNLVSRGVPEAILAAVDEVIELAAGRPNVLLGTGAVPYETPPENILLIREYVA